MAELEKIRKNPVVTDSSEESALALAALRVLVKHYPNYKWGVEFTPASEASIGTMVIRLMDIPTEVCYLINPKDLDRIEMKSVMRGGGHLLEALGFKVKGASESDDVRSKVNTVNGLIVPDPAAVPDTNPGYEKIKTQYNQHHGT